MRIEFLHILTYEGWNMAHQISARLTGWQELKQGYP